MTLLIIPEREVYGWFASWDLASLFADLLTGAEADS